MKAQTEANGRYGFNLEKDASYKLSGEKTDFRSDEANITTQRLTVSTEIKQDLFLEPIIANKAIRIENIYYDFDKWNIRPDAAKELE